MRYAIDGKYPVETKEQLEKTAIYFDKFLPRFHPKDRIKIASVMSKRASELGVCLDRDWVNNYSRAIAGTAQVSPDFNKNVEIRKHACLNKTIQIGEHSVSAVTMLDKISSAINDKGSFITVDELFSFDKLAGIEYQWDKTIPDPVMTVFGSLNNSKYDAVNVIGTLTNYDLVKIAANEADTLSDLAEHLGEHFTKEFVRRPSDTVRELDSKQREVARSIFEKRKR